MNVKQMIKRIKINLMSANGFKAGRFASRLRASFTALFIISASVGLTGCGLFDPAPQPPIYLKEVNFTLDQDANDNSAVPVDLLIIYDADMLKVLLELEAKDYYSIANQLKADYPDLADILHWELTPGQVIKKYPIQRRSKSAQGALIFANYFAPGPHRIRLGSSEVINVHMKANEFCVVEQGCFGAPTGGASAQSAALKSNFNYSSVQSGDPAAAIASVNAAKAAKAAKDSSKEFKRYVENVAKFKANPSSTLKAGVGLK